MGHYTISACTGNDESSENLGFNILYNAPMYATYVKVSLPPPPILSSYFSISLDNVLFFVYFGYTGKMSTLGITHNVSYRNLRFHVSLR